jgi:hypothetical protein
LYPLLHPIAIAKLVRGQDATKLSLRKDGREGVYGS